MKKFFYKLTHWETWHYFTKYIPLTPFWLWYCLRARSFWFFTPSNPTLTFGGFEGESKKEMYDQLPPGTYPSSIYIPAGMPETEASEKIQNSGFGYPFAVKPDVGMMGYMFRIIQDAEQWSRYHASIPVTYIVQELVNYPLEVSVFYYRFPGADKGTISGFLRKENLRVTGDGHSTLWELIQGYPRVAYRLDEMRQKHQQRLNDILPEGEIYSLSYAFNLSRGGKLVSLAHENDDRLLKLFDDLSHYSKYFYYGRYDVRCASVEDLKEGKNFSILEFNGAGAEPHHMYGCGNSLLQAYSIILYHWKVLYSIARENNQRGIAYWKHADGLRFLRNAKKHFKALKKMDQQLEV